MDPTKILVIRDGRMGEILMITPVLRALSQQWPQSEIHVLAGGYGARILRHNPRVHALHDYDRQLGFFEQIRTLRALEGPFDLILALEEGSHFAQVARVVSGGRRVGYSNAAAWLYDDHLSCDPSIHMITNHLLLTQRAGVAAEHCSDELEISLSVEDLELADLYLKGEGLAEGESFVFLHPPCGPQDPLRSWPNFYFAELADRIHNELGLRVLINGSPEEAHLVDAVVAQSSCPLLVNTDPNLGLMMGLLARSSLFIGGHTGVTQMASALQKPLVVIFGSHDPGRFGPRGLSEREVVLRSGLACAPCSDRHSPEKTKCLEQGFGDCMVAFDVDRVFQVGRGLLDAS